MSQLQEIWDREQCPIVNGVMFADGTVKLVKLDATSKQTRSVVRGSETSLESLQGSGTILNSFYTEMGEAVDESRSVKAVCGGAGMGADGFVALLQHPSNQLEWVAFFDFANPFVDVRISEGRVIARNNLGEIWSFQIDAPQEIRIEGRLTN